MIGVAEMMNFPGVVGGAEGELAKLALARHVDGHRRDGERAARPVTKERLRGKDGDHRDDRDRGREDARREAAARTSEPAHESAGHSQQSRHHSCPHKQDDRVDTKNYKWFRPRFIAFDIDQPIAQRQKLQRQSGGKENI